MSLESNKTLGGVGAILLAIPFLNLVGIILVLIALKGMAEHYEDDDIFKNALYGFIFGIIGVVALIVVIVMFVIGIAVVVPSNWNMPFAGFGLLIIVLVVMYVFGLIGAIFYKKSLNILSEKTGEHMFDTGGLLLLIGAIIPLVGEILKFIAWILVAIGFFSIKTSVQQSAPTPPVVAGEKKKFCQYCGSEINLEATFCQNCGKKTKE